MNRPVPEATKPSGLSVTTNTPSLRRSPIPDRETLIELNEVFLHTEIAYHPAKP
jgi:hypothetical protein